MAPQRLRPGAWTPQDSASVASLRGLSVVSDAIVWASGAGGSVLRTVDGGKNWEVHQVDGAETLDFRDVHAFSDRVAWLITSGDVARIYRTVDACESFELMYESSAAGAFYDALSFWGEDKGIVFGDPVDNRFHIVRTSNGGKSWAVLGSEGLPIPLSGEAGFAASGTCLCVYGEAELWIGTGGTAARILHSSDAGASWEVMATPIISGVASAGIFSVAFQDAQRGIIVGGDYASPSAADGNAAFSLDGGKNWALAQSSPGGYRSGAAYVPGSVATYVAVGTTGSDFSVDGGRIWQAHGERGFHAVAFSPSGKFGWAVGGGGRLARCELAPVE